MEWNGFGKGGLVGGGVVVEMGMKGGGGKGVGWCFSALSSFFFGEIRGVLI